MKTSVFLGTDASFIILRVASTKLNEKRKIRRPGRRDMGLGELVVKGL